MVGINPDAFVSKCWNASWYVTTKSPGKTSAILHNFHWIVDLVCNGVVIFPCNCSTRNYLRIRFLFRCWCYRFLLLMSKEAAKHLILQFWFMLLLCFETLILRLNCVPAKKYVRKKRTRKRKIRIILNSSDKI